MRTKTNPRTDRTVKRTGLSCIQYPTGIAPRSSSTGSVASANTTASSGQPKLRSLFAIFRPKLEALMESVAALASPEAANQANDIEAHNITKKTNLTGRSSKNGKVSFFSTVSRNPSEEALFARRGPKWREASNVRRGFDLKIGSLQVIMGKKPCLSENFRWVLRVEDVEVNGSDGDADREAAIANRKIEKSWGVCVSVLI